MATTGMTNPGVLVTSFRPSTPSSLVTTYSIILIVRHLNFSVIIDVNHNCSIDSVWSAKIALKQCILKTIKVSPLHPTLHVFWCMFDISSVQ